MGTRLFTPELPAQGVSRDTNHSRRHPAAIHPVPTRNRHRAKGHGVPKRNGAGLDYVGQPMSDRGSLLPMIAGLVALCGVTVVGIIDSTDLALARTNLQSTADMAALVGAESFDPLRAQFDGTSLTVRLTNRDVRRAVRAFVAETRAGVRLVAATTPDRTTARVTVSSVWSPPLGNQFFPLRIRLEATASARANFGG